MNFGTNINLQIVGQEDPTQKEEVVMQQNQACATKSKTDDNFFCVFICLLLLIALCVVFVKKSLCKAFCSDNIKDNNNIWKRHE